jgi:hypothetical protein
MKRPFLFVPVFLMAGAVSALANVDSGLLALVPAGAKVIGALDVTRARNSDFGQYLLAKAQADDVHFQEMINETGFDPRRDLQNIVFATSAPAGGTGSSGSFAILARGNFDQNKIRALATSKGHGTIVLYGGVDMIVDAKSPAQQTAIGFLDVGVAVMGDLNTLKQIIDNRAAPTVLDSDFKSKIQNIGTANDAWFVSTVGAPNSWGASSGQQGPGQAQMKALQGVVQASGGVKFGATIDTTIDAVTRSAQDAQSLSDVIRFMASMVQMQRQSDPRAGILANALDGMTLQNNGAAVHLAVSMPEKSLEQLAESGAAHAGAAH